MSDHLTIPIPEIHAAATWFMVGLIWFVQVVHYPLMGSVPAEGFSEYSRSHQRRTTWVVGPGMLVEAASAVALVLGTAGERETVVLRWIGLGLLAMVWASTAAVQVPLHGRLSLGLDRAACRRLVITNWIRTLAWTVRGVIALLIL